MGVAAAAALTHVRIPYKPRQWAEPFHASLARWVCLVLHRRAGKTTAVINHHQRAATDDTWEAARLRHLVPAVTKTQLTDLLRQRFYGHILPTYKQAKLTTWEMLKYFATPIPGVTVSESELRVDYPNGSRLQLFGADNPDAFVDPRTDDLVPFDGPNVVAEEVGPDTPDQRDPLELVVGGERRELPHRVAAAGRVMRGRARIFIEEGADLLGHDLP